MAGNSADRQATEEAPALDIFTDELLAALARQGCPICRVVTDSVHRWIDSFWREGRNDRDTRRTFFAAGGFCHDHALALETLAQGTRGRAAIADVYRWLASRDIALLDASVHPAPGRRLRRRKPQMARARECPACVEREQTTERKLAFLTDILHDERGRRRYESSSGLCVPHLLRAVAQTAENEPAVSCFLAADGRRRLVELRVGLDEFDRKRESRFRDEPKGQEQQAPSDAIARYAGGAEET